jgi:hypothetical protein
MTPHGRVSAAPAPSGLVHRLRRIGVRQVRLACGLVLFAYIFSHFFNHALGNLSYEVMEAWLGYHIAFWRTGPINIALYLAASVQGLACGRSTSAGTFATPGARSRSSSSA